MTIKNLLCFLVLLPCSYLSFSQRTEGDTWAKVKAQGSGTLAIYYSEQGGLIEDINGKPAGLCVEILKDFVEFIKKKIQQKNSPSICW